MLWKLVELFQYLNKNELPLFNRYPTTNIGFRASAAKNYYILAVLFLKIKSIIFKDLYLNHRL